jgi:hypothetical protein
MPSCIAPIAQEPLAQALPKQREPYILTSSGRKARIFKPDPADVHLGDIAKSLAKQCRFTGHCRGFWSVARHSVLVADILREQGKDPVTQLYGLLHDAAEAYLGDISSPLKRHIYAVTGVFVLHINEVEGRWQDAIERALAGAPLLDEPNGRAMAAAIKTADLIALATERRDLMPDDGEEWESLIGIEPTATVVKPDALWVEGEVQFVKRYTELSAEAMA